ncbi:hypothetical protein HNY73_017902 [Argiope bruennichi]|uniref:Uncharacterized protein n=1 Tax=Argiope bruennichi TaxID=94029 RepID=A0A8T0EC91_ARGBR|nr:hypothetical protein HNY73_017902 [Argiope bruennichi]
MEEVSTEFELRHLVEDEEDSWEDLTNEFGRMEGWSTSENFKKEYSIEEEKENGALRKLPSFEVLAEFPKPDFSKLLKNIFTELQAIFTFKNMITNLCSLLGLKGIIYKSNLFRNSQDVGEKKTTIKMKKKSNKKHREIKSRDFTASVSGLVPIYHFSAFLLAYLAISVFTFVIGYNLGWWSRDAMNLIWIHLYYISPFVIISAEQYVHNNKYPIKVIF